MLREEEIKKAADDSLPAALRAAAERAEAGASIGLLAFELHPDGTATRHILGSVRADGYRVAGMAFALAHAATSTV